MQLIGWGLAPVSGIAPYTPVALSSPIVNAAVGGSGTPYPYISVSEYQFAPTAIDTTTLVTPGDPPDQVQSLSDVIRRASSVADEFVFGADPAAKGASLCATLSVETAIVPVLNGTMRLVCDYKPIIQVNGIDIGPSMASLSSIGSSVAAAVWIGRRTIYVPLLGYSVRQGDTGNPNWISPPPQGGYVAVWSYVNGYPHSFLASNITSGTNTCVLQATDGGTGLFGIIPNQTQMTIVDGALTERFTVQSVSGTTLTATTNFVNNHTVPQSPDAIPVTTLPAAISQAVIFLTTALIKTEGDAAIVLDEMNSPRNVQRESGGMSEDLDMACKLLKPYRISSKIKT